MTNSVEVAPWHPFGFTYAVFSLVTGLVALLLFTRALILLLLLGRGKTHHFVLAYASILPADVLLALLAIITSIRDLASPSLTTRRGQSGRPTLQPLQQALGWVRPASCTCLRALTHDLWWQGGVEGTWWWPSWGSPPKAAASSA